MIGKIFGVLTLLSLAFGVYSGEGEAMATAVLTGAGDAVRLTLTLCGMMGFWCGIMKVLEEAGAIRFLARMLRRPLAFFFPATAESGDGMEEICANIAANLLGIGNAATPMALRALEKMRERQDKAGEASADMITLTVLNTCPLTLIPSTLLALRQAAGASHPFAVVLPIWICSTACATLALSACRVLGGFVGKKSKKRREGLYKS